MRIANRKALEGNSSPAEAGVSRYSNEQWSNDILFMTFGCESHPRRIRRRFYGLRICLCGCLEVKYARDRMACQSRPKAAPFLLASSTKIGFRDLPEALACARGLASPDSSPSVGGCPLLPRSTYRQLYSDNRFAAVSTLSAFQHDIQNQRDESRGRYFEVEETPCLIHQLDRCLSL